MVLKSTFSVTGFAVVLMMVLWRPTQTTGQTYVPDDRPGNSLQSFVETLSLQGCIESVSPPALLPEPRFTIGRTNRLCFRLPDSSTLPVNPDSVKNPFVITRVENQTSQATFELPLPVDLAETGLLFELATSLEPNTTYQYSTALFLPKCLIGCDAVVDSSQLQLFCSPYADTVSSVQDIQNPVVNSVQIPQTLNLSPATWWNNSEFGLEAELSDQAGIWQAFLYRRECGQSQWGTVVLDTTFSSSSSPFGFVFDPNASVSFSQDLADGCYEFRVEGKDATHTPESCFGRFELAGNGGVPPPEAAPHARINIDTVPPTSINLTCAQVLNTIELSWSASADSLSGIGLAGYHVLRDGDTLATVSANLTNFTDQLSTDFKNKNFVYQVQPFDSLGNVQRSSGTSTCPFDAISAISMFPEPDFTKGHVNRVSWTPVSEIDSYAVFRALNGEFETAISEQTSDTTFEFNDLIDGAQYSYWVVASDQQNRVIRSDTVQSIQDATLPEIVSFDVSARVPVRDVSWVTQRNIRLNLIARDTEPGKVTQLEISENGQVVFLLPLQKATAIDTVMDYPLQTPDCEPIELTIKVLDAAGNTSSSSTIKLRLDDLEPEPVDLLQCAQLNKANGIKLTWQQTTDPGNCSGLAGYRILRDNELISSVGPNVLTYEDVFADTRQSGQFMYQIQPLDSVGNIQVEGGVSSCDYVGISQILIDPMAEFTPGLSREVCWQVAGALTSLSVYRDSNCDSVPEDSMSFFRPQADMCHTFVDLLDGQNYCYWVAGIDDQQRIVKSEVVHSTQDNSSPVIQDFTYPNGELLNGRLWAYSENLELRLLANDPNEGEIWSCILSENNVFETEIGFGDSLSQIDKSISYSIKSNSRNPEPIVLTIRVIDGAGNESQSDTLNLFLQRDLTSIFAFPNPFNPMATQITIRISDIGEDEVEIYDFFGNLVRRINAKANAHDFVWDGKNGNGDYVANGGYVCVGVKTRQSFKIGVIKRQ